MNFWYEIAAYCLTTLGLWKLFKKCGIEQKWVPVPIYRIYKLAEFADMDEEGMSYLNASVMYYLMMIAMNVLDRKGITHLRTTSLLLVACLMLWMVRIVYQYRISVQLCRIFRIRKSTGWLWKLLWTLVEYVPALVWGWSGAYQPVNKEQTESGEAAGLDGLAAAVTGSGLTVNLTDRSVKNHMKTRYLLRDIHLNIKPGTMVLLLGGSGAGKTTFLNAITGYEPANAQIVLDGDEVYKNFNKMKYKIGFVPQQDLIRYEDTVQKTLTDAAALRLPTEMGLKERSARVKSVLEIFGLTPVRDNIVSKQSGGQKKRISIAMEYISDPSLFILDEPDSGLDGILARDLMRRLNEISREGKIVVVITHTPDRVIEYFDEIIVLGKDANRTGRLVFHGSIEKAREFFGVSKMEEIVKKINCKDEGGEGLADELIEKYAEVRHGEA